MLNSTLKASYIPLVVCDFLTSNLKLQYTGPESVLKCLDNGRQWAHAINVNNCAAVAGQHMLDCLDGMGISSCRAGSIQDHMR